METKKETTWSEGKHLNSGYNIKSSKISCRGDKVTPREEQVARLLSQGLSNRQIATRLGISEQTVKNHVSTIYVKIGCANRVQLALIYSEKYGSSLQLRFPLPSEV